MEAIVEDGNELSEVVNCSDECVKKVEDKVSEVVNCSDECVKKVEDKVSEVVEGVFSRVDEYLNYATSEIKEAIEPVTQAIESNEAIKKVVTVIDEKLATRGCSFSLFGWVVSIHKSHQTDQTVPSK
jgi:hypothetical protein